MQPSLQIQVIFYTWTVTQSRHTKLSPWKETRRAALTTERLCSCHSTAPAHSWLGFAAEQGKACDFYILLFCSVCHFDCPRYMDPISWMKVFVASDCPPHKIMHKCLGVGDLATTARYSRSFVSAQASQLLPELYLRSSRSRFMRKDKPEVKGDPSSWSDSTFTNQAQSHRTQGRPSWGWDSSNLSLYTQTGWAHASGLRLI